jgi:hypothetical protein
MRSIAMPFPAGVYFWTRFVLHAISGDRGR